MAWIESHQALERHPKLLTLAIKLNTDKYGALGRLHCLWYWCCDYAPDGDLTKFDKETIALACGVPTELLIECGFVDFEPYTRVHDWWDYAGRFLQIKFKNYPKKWKRIKTLYVGRSKNSLATPLSRLTNQPTNLDQPTNQPTKEQARAVLDHFNTACKKSLQLTPEREALILKRLKDGHSVADVCTAITNFSKDDWVDRGKYMDLIYAIGVRNKIDNLDRWLIVPAVKPMPTVHYEDPAKNFQRDMTPEEMKAITDENFRKSKTKEPK